MWLFLIKMSSTISFQQWSELKTSFLSQAEQNLHLHFLCSKLLPEINQLKQIPHVPTLLSLSWRQTFRGFAWFHFQPEKTYQNLGKQWKWVLAFTDIAVLIHLPSFLRWLPYLWTLVVCFSSSSWWLCSPSSYIILQFFCPSQHT